MDAAAITALIGATTALITAITALITSFRGSQQIKSHLAVHGGNTTPAASSPGRTASDG